MEETKTLYWSTFKEGKCIIGFRMYDMKVNSVQRTMIRTNPCLMMYEVAAETLKEGTDIIMRHIYSCTNTKNKDVREYIVPVENEYFAKAFVEHIRKVAL